MGADNLGTLSVQIVGDYSTLQDAISQSVQIAESGTASIAAAFNVPDIGSSMTASVEQVGQAFDAASTAALALSTGIEGVATAEEAIGSSDSLTALSDAMSSAGDAATTASGDMGDLSTSASDAEDAASSLGSALSDAGSAGADASEGLSEAGGAANEAGAEAQESESAWEGLGEKFVELAELAGVGLGLAELGKEAVESSAQVQDLTTSFTYLSDSSSVAAEQVETLKSLAVTLSQPFSDVAAQAQKMTAQFAQFGGTFEDVTSVLTVAADASRVMGTSFDGAAQSIDRMVISGTAGARQLATLGVSANSLAQAMGVTADQVSQAFKALDETDRLAALESALGQFAGASADFANNLGETWQNFKTQFEYDLEAVGNAISPLAEALLNTLGGALTALAPAIEGAATTLTSILVPALQDAGSAVSGLASVFGGANLVAIAGATAYIWGFQAAVLAAAAAIGGWDLGTWLQQNVPAVKDFGDALADDILDIEDWISRIPGMNSVLGSMGDTFATSRAAVDQEAASAQELSAKLQALGIDLQQGNQSLQDWETELRNAARGATDFASNLQAADDSLGGLNTSLLNLKAATVDVNSATQSVQTNLTAATAKVADLKAGLDLATAAYQAGSITLQQLQVQQTAYTASVNALNNMLGKVPDGVGAVDAAAAKLTTTLITAQATVTTLQAAYDKTGIGAAALGVALENLKKAQDAYNAVTQPVYEANQQIVDTFADLTGELISGKITVEQYTAAMNTWGAANQDANEEFVQSTGDVSAYDIQVTAGAKTTQVWTDNINTLTDGMGNSIKQITNFGGSTGDATEATQDAGKAAGDWVGDLSNLVSSFTDAQKTSVDFTNQVIYSDGVYTTAAGVLANLAKAWDAVATAAQGATAATQAANAASAAAGTTNPNGGSPGSLSQFGPSSLTPYGSNSASMGDNTPFGQSGVSGSGGSTSMLKYFEDLASMYGQVQSGVTDAVIQMAAAAAGLVQVGNQAFDTLSQFNSSIAYSGYQLDTLGNIVNAAGDSMMTSLTNMGLTTQQAQKEMQSLEQEADSSGKSLQSLINAYTSGASAQQNLTSSTNNTSTAVATLGAASSAAATETNSYLANLEGFGLSAAGAIQELAYLEQEAADTGQSLASLVAAASGQATSANDASSALNGLGATIGGVTVVSSKLAPQMDSATASTTALAQSASGTSSALNGLTTAASNATVASTTNVTAMTGLATSTDQMATAFSALSPMFDAVSSSAANLGNVFVSATTQVQQVVNEMQSGTTPGGVFETSNQQPVSVTPPSPAPYTPGSAGQTNPGSWVNGAWIPSGPGLSTPPANPYNTVLNFNVTGNFGTTQQAQALFSQFVGYLRNNANLKL